MGCQISKCQTAKEALEKRKVQQKLDNMREKNRINAFKEKIKPKRYNEDG